MRENGENGENKGNKGKLGKGKEKGEHIYPT